MSILVVEDNQINLEIFNISLQENGYEVVAVSNAGDAVKELEIKSDISLIITDIMMPGMDGLEFITQIKQNSEWNKIPFVFVSGMSDLDTVKKAKKLGCNNFIVKPVKGDQLINLVKEILPHEKLIMGNKHRNSEDLGLNLFAYNNIVRMFVSLLEKEINRLEKAINEGKCKEHSPDLVQLRESAATLKAERVFDLLNQMGQKVSAKECALLLDEFKLLLKTAKVSLN